MAGKFRVSQLVAAISFVAAIALYVVFKILAKKRGWVLYVNTDASKELMEHDRLVEEESKAKKKAKKSGEDAPATEKEIPAEDSEDSKDTEDNAVEIPVEDSEDSKDTEDNAVEIPAEDSEDSKDTEDNDENADNEKIPENNEETIIEEDKEDKEDKENGTNN